MWIASVGSLALCLVDWPMGITIRRLEGEEKASSQASFPCRLLQGPLTLCVEGHSSCILLPSQDPLALDFGDCPFPCPSRLKVVMVH